jgi:hypothetical protein
MSRYERDILLRDLQKNVMAVYFTKVNGEKREMRCTLIPGMLPPNSDINHLEEEHKKPENDKVVVCWDVVKGAWRSFRVESVEYVEILDAYQY